MRITAVFAVMLAVSPVVRATDCEVNAADPTTIVCERTAFRAILDAQSRASKAADENAAKVSELQAKLDARVKHDAEVAALPVVTPPFPWSALASGAAGGAILVLIAVVAAR